MPVTHLSLVIDPNAFGGVTMTSLCRRLSNAGADLNVTEFPSEVTCKFCLRKIQAKRERNLIKLIQCPEDGCEFQALDAADLVAHDRYHH